jgi:hypothetical protein
VKEIYFLSIERALEDIGKAIGLEMSPNTPPRQEFITAWRCSRAAANLHQVLHNIREGRPQWLIIHPVTRRPVATDGAEAEGLLILEELSGWLSRYWDAYHAFPYLTEDQHPEREWARWFRTSKFITRKFGCEDQIGFDREELIYYLDSPAVDMPHRIYGNLSYEYVVQLDARRRNRAGDREQPVEPSRPNPPIEIPQEAAREVPRLTLPTNADAWARAIAATFDLLVRESGDVPSGLEVWLRMNDRPPTNYPITITKDHGLAAIALPGERPLTRDGFNKRWRRYTAES